MGLLARIIAMRTEHNVVGTAKCITTFASSRISSIAIIFSSLLLFPFLYRFFFLFICVRFKFALPSLACLVILPAPSITEPHDIVASFPFFHSVAAISACVHVVMHVKRCALLREYLSVSVCLYVCVMCDLRTRSRRRSVVDRQPFHCGK